MKKKLITMLLLLTFAATENAMAQIKWGVKGGLNMSALSLTGDVINSSNNVGFYIGPTAKLSLPLTGLSIDASALYNQYSADATIDRGDEQITREVSCIKVKQLAIPVNLRYGIGLGSMASVFVFAGPQFAFNMSDDIKSIDWEWKNTYMSVNIGAGVSLLTHLQFNLNYNIGCGKSGRTGNNAHSEFYGKSNAWQLGMAYYF